MPPISPTDLMTWFRIGSDIASFLSQAIPKLVELFQSHDKDESKAMAALDLALEAARKVNDERLRAKHRHDEDTRPTSSSIQDAVHSALSTDEFDEPQGSE